ncbi:uncharacterized protein [Amphiura filiformis]|uniref:uncharacterized protein n=1 Tax=Amphiura filiformis TaxID=82378 RepID=UPI003B20BEC1
MGKQYTTYNEALEIWGINNSARNSTETMDSNHPLQEPLKRIFLWTNPRSLGTAFLKCLSQVPDVKIANGLFTASFLHGPEAKFPKGIQEFDEGHSLDTQGGIVSEFTDVYDATKYSYSWAKAQLQNSYPGKKYLICKESAFSLCENFDLIPPGFCHTFLIRHPYRMWSSWKKNFSAFIPADCDVKTAVKMYNNNYFNYKELHDLLEYLMNNPELAVPTSAMAGSQPNQSAKFDPIIIDADDLQNHPESILPQYCKAIGVPYTDDMLHWKPGTDLLKDWKFSMQYLGGGLQHGEWGFYKTVLESTQFFPCKKLPDRDELDDDVLECADICLPYYEMMYNMRTIRP